MRKRLLEQSQNLCQFCGLCCDGTLFDSVGIKMHDSTQPLQLVGITLQHSENEEYFQLPCVAHQNKACSVYEHRPQRCQNYQCKLLRQFEKQEITWEEATTIVVETVQQRDELRHAMQAVMELPHNLSLNRMTKVFDETQRTIYGTSVIKKFSQIFLQIATIQVRLERFFQEKKPQSSPSK